MTIEKLCEMLNPHFNDCKVHYFYLGEALTSDNFCEYKNEVVQNFYIEPINPHKIIIDII